MSRCTSMFSSAISHRQLLYGGMPMLDTGTLVQALIPSLDQVPASHRLSCSSLWYWGLRL